MQDQNNYSENTTSKERTSRDAQPSRAPQGAPGRRIGSFTAGVTLILVGVLLIVYFFKPFDLGQLLRFSPALLILLGIEIIWQYFHQDGRQLRYDFFGTLFCLAVIGLAGLGSVLYPLLNTYGPAHWKAEQQVSSEIFDALYAQLPAQLQIQSLDVDCDIVSTTALPETMKASDLTDADRVTLHIELGPQESKAGFAAQMRELFDSFDTTAYPNLSAVVYGQCGDGEYSAHLSDRFALRLDIEGLMAQITGGPDGQDGQEAQPTLGESGELADE